MGLVLQLCYSNPADKNYATGETITIADADIGNGGGASPILDVVAVANTLGIGNISNRIYKLNIAVDPAQANNFFDKIQATIPPYLSQFRNVNPCV